MLVRESQKKKNEGVGSIPLPSFKTIGIIALIIIIWLTWDSGNTESTSAPFYTTWWFWTLVVLFILSTTFLIWNFVSKKKKQEELAQEKKKQSHNHDDDHTDPKVEEHAHDNHAHHGDDWFTKWVTKGWTVIVLLLIVGVIGILIKYAFFNNWVMVYPGKESARIYLVDKDLLNIQTRYHVNVRLDEGEKAIIRCHNTGSDGLRICTYSQEIVYGKLYSLPPALDYTLESTNGKTFIAHYERTEVD